jgi:tRNA pseudouridine-54 N-methylase
MKLHFLLPSSTIRSETKKTLKSVVGGQERVDVIARCLQNLYRWQKRINQDLSLILYLSHPDELSVLIIPLSSIKTDLRSEMDSTKEILDILSNPKGFGLKFEKISFAGLLEILAETNAFYYFSPEGKPIEQYKDEMREEKSICFVLGSQHDLSQEQEEELYKKDTKTISLGKRDYLASHVVTIACHYFLKLLD